MKIIFFIGMRVLLVTLAVLPTSIFGRQLLLPKAPSPLLLVESDYSWMTLEERAKLGIKEETKPEPKSQPTQKADVEQLEEEYEYDEYGMKVEKGKGYKIEKTDNAIYGHSYTLEQKLIADRALLWGFLLPGGGSFSVGRADFGMLHVGIQVILPFIAGYSYSSAVNSYAASIADGKNLNPKDPPTQIYLWLSILAGVASKVYDMWWSYKYVGTDNYNTL